MATDLKSGPQTPDITQALAADRERRPHYNPPTTMADLPLSKLRISTAAPEPLRGALKEYHTALGRLKEEAEGKLRLQPIDLMRTPVEDLGGEQLNRILCVTEVLREASTLAGGGSKMCKKMAAAWTSEMKTLDDARRTVIEAVSRQLREVYSDDTDQRFRGRVHEASAVQNAKRAAATAGKKADAAHHESGRLSGLQTAILVELSRFLDHARG